MKKVLLKLSDNFINILKMKNEKKWNSIDSLLNKNMIEKIEKTQLRTIGGGDEVQLTTECLILSYEQCHVTQDAVCGGNDLCTCTP